MSLKDIGNKMNLDIIINSSFIFLEKHLAINVKVVLKNCMPPKNWNAHKKRKKVFKKVKDKIKQIIFKENNLMQIIKNKKILGNPNHLIKQSNKLLERISWFSYQYLLFYSSYMYLDRKSNINFKQCNLFWNLSKRKRKIMGKINNPIMQNNTLYSTMMMDKMIMILINFDFICHSF